MPAAERPRDQLLERTRQLEPLLDISPSAVVIMDLESNVVAWNPAAAELFGYTADEAVGRNLDDLVAKTDELHQMAVDYSEQTLGKHQIRTDTRRTRKDGTLVDVELRAAPLLANGEPIGMFGIYHDITELTHQHRFLETLLEMSPEAIVTTTPDDAVTSWNPAAERLFGHTAEEAVGRNIDDLVARGDLHAEGLELSGSAMLGPTAHKLTQRTRKDGSLVDVDIVGGPITVRGELVGKHVFYHDISELQRQRRYYEAVLDVSPAAIVTVDREGKVTSWNPAAERMFGYLPEEAMGQDIDDLVAQTDELKAEAIRISLEGRSTLTKTGGFLRRQRKDGTLIDVEVAGVPVFMGGEHVGDCVVYHDISELQQERRYYEALFESSPVAVALVDSDGKVTAWNPAAEELFGYSAEEAIGGHIDDLVANSDEIRAEAEALTARGMSGDLAHLITRRTRKDGTLVDVEMFGAPVIVAGERAGLYGMWHDIRELQQARREAEAATRAKSAFLATMSHEIRTPLNAVIGMTGLLLDTDLTLEQRGFGEIIRQSGDALLAVINEILDFSKIEAGRLDLEQQPFRLRECVESALELVATAAADKSLDLAYVIDPRTPASIVGDFTRLRQILLNLLTNAVKFTERGEVVLRVDASPTWPAGGGDAGSREIHFAVRDTGIGIPEDRMESLFDAFTQVDASTTRRYGGTGLGLAISKRLAEQMGGRMWVTSRVGEGSTFHLTIQAATAAGSLPAEELDAIPQLKGKRVMIVDDNATNREILRRQTQSWGMIPREAASPLEALEWVRRGEPVDLAILDMQMPEMDGLTLAEEIRRHADAESLPLVMLTSLGRRALAPSGVEFAAYLTKPIRPSQLYDALVGIFAPPMAPLRVSRPEGPAASRAQERHQLRILLAEDNAVNQRVALLLLEKLGYRADVAADGREALQALERQSYDVVLMDVQMPEMDGLEATRTIIERFPGAGRPRIIAMTAGASEADREACLAAGMDDYVSKPIRQEELVAALERSATAGDTSVARSLDSEPVIDPDALATLRRMVGGNDALAEVRATFLEDTERILATLRGDIEAGRTAEVRRHAHSLKSAAASFGAEHLSDLCRSLEDLARAGRSEGAASLVEAMAAEFARVREALRPGSDR